jgi:hypothetical protein
VRRAGRSRAAVAVLALAVVLLTLCGAGLRSRSARPRATAGTAVAGHSHRPQILQVRQPDRDTEQHRRTVPVAVAAAGPAVGPPRGEGPAGPDQQAPSTTPSRPTGRGPPAGM